MSPRTKRSAPSGRYPAAAAETPLVRRKQFGRFTDEDARLLAELREVFRSESPALVDRFYEHLLAFDELRPLLADDGTVVRLKDAQHEYLISLASGSYGEGYAARRQTIGRIHEKIGLDPQWYVGTYGLYFELLLPIVHRFFRDDAERLTRASAALAKLFVLDMQLVLDAYYETRQRKVVEWSQRLAAVGELAASIAHEVRNPLAGIKGALEMLRKDLSTTAANQEVVDEIVAQIERLEHLVRDLLNFAHPRPINPVSFDVHEQLDRLLRAFNDRAASAGVTVQRSYGPASGRLFADPQQMEQVFINLIQNALQAMEEGGTLTLSTQVDAGQLVIALRDTGKGIPESALPSIFQPFFTTRHRGSGLGLPIVRRIVEDHGGSVEVRNGSTGGCVATLRLPWSEESE